MKKILFIIGMMASLCSVAQNTAPKVYVCDGYDDDDYNVATYKDIRFSADGDSLTIGNDTYAIADIDSITFSKPQFPSVNIVWNGASATVTVAPSITGVKYTVSGGHVTITSTNTTDELLYVLSGTSDDGSLTINGNYKMRLNLAGVSLKSSKGPVLDIECGKRIEVKMLKNTENYFEDSAGGVHNGAIYTKGHMEFKGKGTLRVKGNTKHAISVKEYCKLKNSTGAIEILGAVNDGLHCGEGEIGDPDNYFMMNGGTLTVSNCGKDCIDSSDYGTMYINGGTINLNVSQDDGNGLAVDSLFHMTGGEIVAEVTGPVSNAIRFCYDAYLSGGTIKVNVTGNGSKGIKAKRTTSTTDTVLRGGFAHFQGTNIEMTLSGGHYSLDNSDCTGIRVDRDLYQTAGDISISVLNNQAIGLSARTDHWDGGTRNIK